MAALSREIVIAIISEAGPEELLKRLSDPFWFQAFGCVLGFDWHSSGLTTTTCGAIKEGLRGIEEECGLFVCGGKGGVSRKTPNEIMHWTDRVSLDGDLLVRASRMSAKVDSAAIQDGYKLYHHVFFFTRSGSWAIVQQGMNETTRYARRYHWLGSRVRSFVEEPHTAICSERREKLVLNMVSCDSADARKVATEVAQEGPEKVVKTLKRLKDLNLPPHHQVLCQDISPDRLRSVLIKSYETQPADFEALLGIKGVGPKTIRALSLISELIYGTPPSFSDPARFSFAHGGKDGHPYPIKKEHYDRTIDVLHQQIGLAKIGRGEKLQAIRRLFAFAHGLSA
jgi:hypothetical protein